MQRLFGHHRLRVCEDVRQDHSRSTCCCLCSFMTRNRNQPRGKNISSQEGTNAHTMFTTLRCYDMIWIAFLQKAMTLAWHVSFYRNVSPTWPLKRWCPPPTPSAGPGVATKAEAAAMRDVATAAESPMFAIVAMLSVVWCLLRPQTAAATAAAAGVCSLSTRVFSAPEPIAHSHDRFATRSVRLCGAGYLRSRRRPCE